MTNGQTLFFTITTIFFIISMIVYFISEYEPNNDIFNKTFDTIISTIRNLLISLLFSFILTGIIWGIGYSNLDIEEKITSQYDLVSLDTNEDVNGNLTIFFVGSGYISEDLYYHFFYNTSRGIKYEKIRAEQCYIIETNDKPKFVKYGMYPSDPTDFFYDEDEVRSGRKVLYIPKGTIKTNYKVN